jgi:hypothetical protein
MAADRAGERGQASATGAPLGEWRREGVAAPDSGCRDFQAVFHRRAGGLCSHEHRFEITAPIQPGERRGLEQCQVLHYEPIRDCHIVIAASQQQHHAPEIPTNPGVVELKREVRFVSLLSTDSEQVEAER